VPTIPREDRIESSRGGPWREPHHDAGVPPRVAGVNDPSDVAVLVDFDTGHGALCHEPLGMLAFDEQRTVEIDRTFRRAALSHLSHWVTWWDVPFPR
jgi:hypothetical protein